MNHRFVRANRRLAEAVNRAARAYDGAMGALRLGGRRANYDDEAFEFLGGANETLRTKHYDKSLRLLWKAEDRAPFLPFRDASAVERSVLRLADESMGEELKEVRRRLSMPEYKALLNREYTRREKEAIVAVLSAIGHGEAYAWLVSADLLKDVKSTGARAALTMQVLEEAKHFVVLRELLRAFDVPIPRQTGWEYLFLEGVLSAKGLEKLFGMNVVVEGIALSFFGLMSELPGLELLRSFHLDESRHTGLPANYLKEFPLTWWRRNSPAARLGRLKMILPAVALIPALEEDLAELGIDAFDFGGSVLRKIAVLCERNGFLLPVPMETLMGAMNGIFNAYCRASRPGHAHRDFTQSDTTRDAEARAVEREIFYGSEARAS